MARWSSTWGVGAALQQARVAREAAEREALFDSFVELGAPRIQARIAGRLARFPPVGALEQRLFDLWLTHVTQQLRSRMNTNEPFALSRALVELVRSLTVTQRQTQISVRDSFADDDFSQRKMSILASGLCNCEMSNFIVWAALRKLGHLAYLFETGLREQLRGSHLLLYVVSPQGAAFVDAWSELPCFHLTGFIPDIPDSLLDPSRYRATRYLRRALTTSYCGRHPAGVPELSEFASLELRTDGVYPADAFRAGGIRWPPRDDAHPDAAAALQCASAAERTPVEPVWRDYVILRRQHLEGQLERPAQAYTQFAARADVPSKLQLIAQALAKRQV